MWNVARRAFLGFVAVVVIFLILNTGANAITISNVTNATPMASTVWILWNVSSEANNTVEYSVNPDLSNSFFSGWSNNTDTPMVKLWSLQPATTYYYRTWSFNTSNESDYINSSIYSFTTQECVSYRLVNVTDSSITRIDHPIQEAIDMICLDGGIVELNNGTFNISTPIRIRENNITFRGQGMNVTRIHVTVEDADAIVLGRWDDWRKRCQDIDNNPYFWKPYGVKYPQDHENHPENWTDNTIIENFTIDGLSTSTAFGYVGIGGAQLWNTCISSVEIIGDGEDHSCLIYLGAAVFPTVKDCEFKNGGRGAMFAVGSGTIKVINNLFYHCTHYDGLEFNGGLCCGDNLVKGNHFISGGGMNIYSSHDVAVTENLIENGHGHNGGLILMLSNDITVSKNIIKNSNYELGAIRVSWAFYSGNINITITNNLMYNNRDHGIFIDVDNRDTDRWANLSLILTSNTVAGSQKSGIFFGIDKDTSLAEATLRSHLKINSTIRNNIVVNNGEAGINSAQNIVVDEDGVKTVTGQDIEYNDVWNNTGGNYVDCDPGDNDISTDPLFADPANGDFHLKSQAGRWNGSAWVNDTETSPCIDAGDPSEKDPDGTRINMGAYGGTWEASKSPHYGIVTGNVTDKDTSEPIEGALVSTNGYSNTTDANGSYSITLPVGNYTLTASKTGYHLNSTTVQILENQTTRADFQLTEDTTPPEISNVNATSITPTTATITWETDENSDSKVYYGETEDLGEWNNETELATSHSITLTGLSPNTTYYYQVYSTDEAGNTGNSSIKSFTTTEETGLVGYWKFDEGSGSIAYDSSGNNNNGTIHGANWTTGKIGNALHFDGDNNYVDCGNDTSLNITNAITIAMWIKTTQNDQGWMIAKYGFDNIGGYGLCIHDGKLQFTTKVGDTWDDYQSDQSINDGVWHHVAGVFNGSTKVLYIDGNLDKSKPYSGSLVPNSDPLFIGKSTTEWPNPFSGSIDEGYIYKRGLTPEEIQELYQAGLFGIITGNVTDKDTGQPIIGATVTTDGYSNTTNNTGGYIITIPIGNYTVTASKTGYHSNSTTAQVFENQTTVVDFILSRHKRKLPVAKPVCATGIAILIVVVYWRYRRRRRRMRSGGFIVLVPGVAVEWSSFYITKKIF